MYKFIFPLIVLVPQDSNVTLIVKARPWFRFSMWISSLAGISKILCTSEVPREFVFPVKLIRRLYLFDEVCLTFDDRLRQD